MSSRELKTSIFTHVLRTRENSDASNTLDEIYLVFTKKKVNILYIYATLLWTSFHNVTKICIIDFNAHDVISLPGALSYDNFSVFFLSFKF